MICQVAQIRAIEARLNGALTVHGGQLGLDAQELWQAGGVATMMFQKSRGEQSENYNDFHHSAGHVLAYTFLGLERQWAQTPEMHQTEARRNGMERLIQALQNGHGNCDTRLCEEVLQTIGLPLSAYATAHPEIVAIRPAAVGTRESRDIIFDEAKKVLTDLMQGGAELRDAAPPDAWRAALSQRLRRDHPRLSSEQENACVQQIESDWPTFHALVAEQRIARG